MFKSGMTIKEATERFLNEINDVPTQMIEDLSYKFKEVTKPCSGDCVYVTTDCEHSGYGEIVKVNLDNDENKYEIALDDYDMTIEVSEDKLIVERDSVFPMWGTMWSFRNSLDNHWLEEKNGIYIMSECGFRVYYSEDYGYYFGIDGAGYSFFDEHWVPLYKARGLNWHDPATEDNKN